MSSPEPDAAEPLGMTVHSLPVPAAALQGERVGGRLKMLLVLLICAAPVAASYFTFYVVRPGNAANAYGNLIEPQVPMPALQARTLDGQPLALRSLRGQWLLVVVDSGTCAQACERHLYIQRQLREMMGRERDRVDKLWLVVDDAPVPAALRAALAATPAMTIARLPRAAAESWLQAAPGRRVEEHLYLVDPLGHWMMRTPVNPDPIRFKRDLERLLRASAGWDQPGRQPVLDEPAAVR